MKRAHYLLIFSSRRRLTRFDCDWSSDVCSSDLVDEVVDVQPDRDPRGMIRQRGGDFVMQRLRGGGARDAEVVEHGGAWQDIVAEDLWPRKIGRAWCRERV